jgi:DNA-binding transcriptional regulator LsrR (DeoR family)
MSEDEDLAAAQPGGIEPQKRRRLSDEERKVIALARHRPVPDPEDPRKNRLPTWDELAVQFDREPHILRNAVEEAFCRRLVKTIELPKPPVECGRVESLEIELRNTYPKLQVALVLDTEPVLRDTQGPLADDESHRVLGHAVAKLMADGLVFGNHSTIGLGAGRGVYYTVDAFSAREPLLREGIIVVSLTGSVEARDYLGNVAFNMDADIHGLMMVKCFHGASVRFICAPIAGSDPLGLQRIRSQTVLAADAWREQTPTHALVGVGVLARGHRFYEEIKNPRRNSVLAPIQGHLRTLIECCEEIHQMVRGRSDVRNYYPVADICHRLFFVPPPSAAALDKTLHSRVDALIGEVNSRMLTVSHEQLQSIGKIIVVAGTDRKARAIQELLDGEKYNIHLLCTDKRAALKILHRD